MLTRYCLRRLQYFVSTLDNALHDDRCRCLLCLEPCAKALWRVFYISLSIRIAPRYYAVTVIAFATVHLNAFANRMQWVKQAVFDVHISHVPHRKCNAWLQNGIPDVKALCHTTSTTNHCYCDASYLHIVHSSREAFSGCFP